MDVEASQDHVQNPPAPTNEAPMNPELVLDTMISLDKENVNGQHALDAKIIIQNKLVNMRKHVRFYSLSLFGHRKVAKILE